MTSNVSATRPRRSILSLWLLAFSCLVLSLLLYAAYVRYGPNQNRLALGERSNISEVFYVNLQPPAELDFKSKSEVLQLRREAVEQYPELLAGSYRPSTQIFGQIVDGLPWWGIAGQFYYGNGEQSIAGESEESRFILNPYLLIAADPWRMWDKNSVSEASIQSPNFLFYCPPQYLFWKPHESYGEVGYSANCASALSYRNFDLISYNARDMNLNYIYVSYADSQNVTKGEIPESAYAIPHYIHQGGSCGYPGGCNNMSPPTPPIDGLIITGYPVRVVTWLWEEKPASVSDAPDMTFVLVLK